MSVSKYRAKKTVIDGIIFDSKKEAKRYSELKLLEKAGEIKDLRLQVKYQLIPPIRNFPRSTYYIADFVYFDIRKNKKIVEDCKGFKTEIYKLKKKMMMYFYGIEIFET